MQGQSLLLPRLPERDELRLDPLQQHCERLGGVLGEWSLALLKLGAERSDWTAALCKVLSVADREFYERAQPRLRRVELVPSFAHGAGLSDAFCDDRIADLSLGLKVVVDIAE